MKTIINEEFVGKYCEISDNNYLTLLEKFKLGKMKRPLLEYKNLFISSDLELQFTSLNSDELMKLNLKEITLIDGFWYLKESVDESNQSF